MSREEVLEQINEVFTELNEIDEKDRAFIQPRQLGDISPVPDTPMEQLFEYGARHERRVALHHKLFDLVQNIQADGE